MITFSEVLRWRVFLESGLEKKWRASPPFLGSLVAFSATLLGEGRLGGSLLSEPRQRTLNPTRIITSNHFKLSQCN